MDPVLAQWLTWALQALIVTGLIRVLKGLDEATKSLSDLRESLPKTYVPFPAFEIHRAENREDIERLRSQVHGHELKCPARLRAVQ